MKNFKLFMTVLLLIGNTAIAAQEVDYSKWSLTGCVNERKKKEIDNMIRMGFKPPCERTDSAGRQICSELTKAKKMFAGDIAEARKIRAANIKRAIREASPEMREVIRNKLETAEKERLAKGC